MSPHEKHTENGLSSGRNDANVPPGATDPAGTEATGDAAALASYYSSPDDLEALSDMPCGDVAPALKRLGPPPFARKGFPIMGLLATIYDHVAERVGRGE